MIPMKLIVEFLIIKMNFSLKRCSSLIKGRKAVLGNSDFSWYTRRQTQQGPLSLAIYLPLSEQFWDEDKQWEGRWQKCSHQQRQSWAEAHTPPETPQTIRTLNLTTNGCDLNIPWSEVGQCCSGSSHQLLSREVCSSGHCMENEL